MGLETATFVDGLVTSNPVGNVDPKSQGDDHLRLIKSVLKNTFPGAYGPLAFREEDDTSAHGPTLTLDRLSATPVIDDGLGRINFNGRDDAGNEHTYASITTEIEDPADTAEDGRIRLAISIAGVITEVIRFDSGGVTFGQGVSLDSLNVTNAITAGSLTTSGEIVSGSFVHAGDPEGEAFRIGNDASIWDVNSPNNINLRGLADPTQGAISFGNALASGVGRSSNATILSNNGSGSIHLRPNGFTSGVNELVLQTDGNLIGIHFSASGQVSAGGIVHGRSGGLGGEAFRIGNDASIWDQDAGNFANLRGLADPTQGYFTFGNSASAGVGAVGGFAQLFSGSQSIFLRPFGANNSTNEAFLQTDGNFIARFLTATG